MYSGDEYYGDDVTSPLVRPQAPTGNRHITSYLSQAGDIEVTVTLLPSGNYAVRVHDLDACETLPASRHFKSEDVARTYALKCATSADTEDYLPF